MRLHLPAALLLSVLAAGNAQERDQKPRYFQNAAFPQNRFGKTSIVTDQQVALRNYIRGRKNDKKSQAPSSSPSFDPSNSPSASPSGSPSDAPSTSPSTQPSASPSAQPSSSPSTNPSSSPSDSPSTQPSSSPSTHPSSLPSSSPSEESERVLYLGDPDSCSSKVSVEEVEQTLGTLQEDLDKVTLIENLEGSGATLQMISLGLSKSIDYGSTEFVTEKIVAEKIESELFPLLKTLSDESRINFNELLDAFSEEEKAVAVYAVELMEGIRVLKEDFKSFITSRAESDEIIQQDRTLKFRYVKTLNR